MTKSEKILLVVVGANVALGLAGRVLAARFDRQMSIYNKEMAQRQFEQETYNANLRALNKHLSDKLETARFWDIVTRT